MRPLRSVKHKNLSQQYLPQKDFNNIKEWQTISQISKVSQGINRLINNKTPQKSFSQHQKQIKQKQSIIEHLKLQLQESKYIIGSLKLEIKKLSQHKLLQNQSISQKNQELQGKISLIQKQNQNLKKQLAFLKQKQNRDKQFFNFYESLVEKLFRNYTFQSNNSENQQGSYNQILFNKFKMYNASNQANHQINGIQLRENINVLNIQEQQNRQNYNQTFFKRQTQKPMIEIFGQSHSNTQSFNEMSGKNKQITNSIEWKQNYPRTPQNVSLRNSWTNQAQKQPKIDRKIGFSPYKLKQRHINNRSRNSSVDFGSFNISGQQIKQTPITNVSISSTLPNKIVFRQKIDQKQRHNSYTRQQKDKSLQLNSLILNNGIKLDKKIYF